ncbi:MAG: phosphotransferase [Candidatus Berkiellales bacterium]
MNKNENITQLLKWLSNALNTQGISAEYKSNVLVQTPWSVVIRIEIDQDCYYLKQTPADLFIEPEIINVIQKNMPDSHTPTILFKSHEFNCFVMNSCGDHSLRTKFNGSIDAELLIRGLNSYIKIQRSLEQDLDDFRAIGVPDWRINLIPDLFVDLLEKKDVLLDDGLTPNEIDQLMKLVPTIKSICEFLAAQKVKATLVNCDFNENNMIINEDTQQISIIDWGESVISHPFFSIASHLQATARRYQLELKGQLLGSLKQKWLSCWSDVANKNELNEIYQNVLRLHPIFSSLGIYRLQAATTNKSKEMQRWFIAGCLQTLLKNEGEG